MQEAMKGRVARSDGSSEPGMVRAGCRLSEKRTSPWSFQSKTLVGERCPGLMFGVSRPRGAVPQYNKGE